MNMKYKQPCIMNKHRLMKSPSPWHVSCKTSQKLALSLTKIQISSFIQRRQLLISVLGQRNDEVKFMRCFKYSIILSNRLNVCLFIFQV